jgi:hypothetical protein
MISGQIVAYEVESHGTLPWWGAIAETIDKIPVLHKNENRF